MKQWSITERSGTFCIRQKCDFNASLFQIKQNNIKPPVLNEAIAPDGEIPQNLDLLVLWRDVGV